MAEVVQPGSLLISRRTVRDRGQLLALVLALAWMMDWLYVNVLVAFYGETGYPGYPFAQHGALFRWACRIFASTAVLWLPVTIRRQSQVLTWCMFLMVILPTAVVAGYARQPTTDIAAMLAAMMVGLVILASASLLPTLRIPSIRADKHLFWLLIIAFSIATYAATIATYGATFRFVTLDEVYFQREVAQAVGAGAFTRYAVTWQAYLINPLIMGIGVSRRRLLMFLAGAGGEVFLFGVAAQRILLALPVVIICFHFLLRGGKLRFGPRATAGTLFIFVVPALVLQLGGFAATIAALVFNAVLLRLFLNGGFISVLYFKFFGNHPHVGFAEVKPFSLFVQSPYDVHYPVALAVDAWGRYSDPNANLFADGFAQLGYSGVAIEAVALAVMFWLLDSVARSRNLSVWLVAMICGGEVTYVVEAATSNIILGGGFALLLVVLALLPKSETIAERPMRRPRGLTSVNPVALAVQQRA